VRLRSIAATRYITPLREGGSLAARMCRCTAWSSYFPAAAYQAKRFNDFLSAA